MGYIYIAISSHDIWYNAIYILAISLPFQNFCPYHSIPTVFTWLNTIVFLTLVHKMDAEAIQTRPLFDALKRSLYP